MNKENIIPRDEMGKPHGLCEEYSPNGYLMNKGYYIHGVIYGLRERYWGYGKLNYKKYYIK